MNDQYGYDIEDLKEGMSASFAKTITEADIVLFAGVSGDNNAVHTNEEFAATTAFGGRIAHGFLTPRGLLPATLSSQAGEAQGGTSQLQSMRPIGKENVDCKREVPLRPSADRDDKHGRERKGIS